MASRRRRQRVLKIMGVVGGGLIAVGLFALGINVIVSDDFLTTRLDSASASTLSPMVSAPSEPAPLDTLARPSKANVACRTHGPAKRLVVGASASVPFEVWAAPDEKNVAVGFAAKNGTALGFVLDPKTISPEKSYTRKAYSPIRRVVPFRVGKNISFETNVDDKRASVQDALTVATTPRVVLGTFKNALTIGSEAEAVPEIIWKLPFRDRIEAMRAIPVPGKGLGVVFRAKDSLWLGWVGEDRKPVGELSKILNTGLRVSTPSIGWNGREAIITFANLGKANAPWTIRMARVAFGKQAPTSFEWTVPARGQGGVATAPNIRGLVDGRWLMVWTEGKAGARVVRAQTLDHEMSPLEDAFIVSKPGANASQGVAAMSKTRGAIFYLAAIGQQYEVWGARIECP